MNKDLSELAKDFFIEQGLEIKNKSDKPSIQYASIGEFIWKDSNLNKNDIRVLLFINNCCRDKGYTWIGQETIANELQISRKQVNRIVKKLEDSKYIRTKAIKQSNNKYNNITVLTYSPYLKNQYKTSLDNIKPVRICPAGRVENVQQAGSKMSLEEESLKRKINKRIDAFDRTTSGTEGFDSDESIPSALNNTVPAVSFINDTALNEEEYMDRFSSSKILLRWHKTMKQFISTGRMYNKEKALATIEANLQQWAENYDNIKYMPNVWRMLPDWKNLTVAPGTFEKYHGFDRLKSNLFDFKDAELRERQRVLSADTELLLAYAREKNLPFNEVKVCSATDIQFLKDGEEAFIGYDWEKQRRDMIDRLWDIYINDVDYKEDSNEKGITFDTKIREAMSDDEYAEYLFKTLEEDI